MQQDSLESLAREALKEYKRTRRWKMIYRIAMLAIIVALFISANHKGFQYNNKPHTAVVTLNGIITAGGDADAQLVIDGLRDAFESNAKGVILQINSPGGSPVQSNQINAEISRLKSLHPNMPVYAVVDDVCASGGYYVAVATDEIYVDKASIVGSIGVRMDSFGFVEAIKKLGIERRLLTAGEHKGILDPFLPAKQGDISFVNTILDRIHQQFISAVKSGRGDKLVDPKTAFSGLFWSGERAVELGLADGLGDIRYIAREKIGAEELVDYSRHPDFLEQFSRSLGASIERVFDSRLFYSANKLRY